MVLYCLLQYTKDKKVCCDFPDARPNWSQMSSFFTRAVKYTRTSKYKNQKACIPVFILPGTKAGAAYIN